MVKINSSSSLAGAALHVLPSQLLTTLLSAFFEVSLILDSSLAKLAKLKVGAGSRWYFMDVFVPAFAPSFDAALDSSSLSELDEISLSTPAPWMTYGKTSCQPLVWMYLMISSSSHTILLLRDILFAWIWLAEWSLDLLLPCALPQLSKYQVHFLLADLS